MLWDKNREIASLNAKINSLVHVQEGLLEEVKKYKARTANQRKELRRLNSKLGMFYKGAAYAYSLPARLKTLKETGGL